MQDVIYWLNLIGNSDSAIWTGHHGQQVIAVVGERYKQIACDVEAKPAVHQYIWTYGDNTVLRPGITYSRDDRVISIDVVQASDFRAYICKAINQVGEEKKEKSFNIDLREGK